MRSLKNTKKNPEYLHYEISRPGDLRGHSLRGEGEREFIAIVGNATFQTTYHVDLCAIPQRYTELRFGYAKVAHVDHESTSIREFLILSFVIMVLSSSPNECFSYRQARLFCIRWLCVYPLCMFVAFLSLELELLLP